VLDELLAGRSEKEVAAKLCLSTRTVHKYVEKIYRVFSVSSRGELMALWIDPPTTRDAAAKSGPSGA
jgi:DNA-binding CsgD family transcriptional regulator